MASNTDNLAKNDRSKSVITLLHTFCIYFSDIPQLGCNLNESKGFCFVGFFHGSVLNPEKNATESLINICWIMK